MSSTDLFSTDLIPSQIQAELPEGYVIRPLQRDDFRRGHLESLQHLTDTGEISEEDWIERFDWMVACKGTYYIVVIAKDANGAGKEIVASATLVAEKKFIHKLATLGHIEDVVVQKDEQSKKLGIKLLATLNHVAKAVGCYKTILNCSPKNRGFYVKSAYNEVGIEMSCRFDGQLKK